MLSVPVGESCGEVKGDGHMVSTGLPPWVAGRSLCGEWGSSTSQPHVSGSLGLSVPPRRLLWNEGGGQDTKMNMVIW